jgi:hypothetical protein
VAASAAAPPPTVTGSAAAEPNVGLITGLSVAAGFGVIMIAVASTLYYRLRQKPITQKTLEKYLNEETKNFSYDETVNFGRNQTLIDLTFIPQQIKEKIINTFEETVPAKRNKLLNYFIEHKLKNLMDVIEEF